ncbi:uncharacterized protein LOC126828504 [Patella vulgata]|uniref:uncharacterized protein LOC126828504 n=1 Tax=Patella vulgata TaxID=6465 RepID=UPI0024A8F783|nr:uncharacterized protein LOC126828504 [Patella vulgata]
MDFTLFCQVASFMVIPTFGFETYQHNIPNGNIVPHPCKPNHLWHGVGHKFALGKENLNFFGKDFASAGHQWTDALCKKDSDGDGKTNGQELGDPNCIWSPESFPERNTDISHPGVCEPWNEPKCQHQLAWLESECQKEEFACDAINQAGISNVTIQFPKTAVPNAETTYICIVFDLPQDDDYHLVATQPIIDNIQIMHHAVLFGCEDDAQLEPNPKSCNMVPSSKCKQVISIWTVGLSGDCIHNSTGFRIGTKGFKRAALQFHWNNPTLSTNYIDQSALVLYFTTNRRITDAGILTVGASFLNIQPRTKHTEYIGICPGECTSLAVKEKVYIASATSHMHYLGVSQKIEQFRNGTKIRNIINDMRYNYDNPIVYKFQEPLELLPGDTISTTCIYNSVHKIEATHFGDSTSDEMCFGFLTYYPKEHIMFSSCTSWKSVPSCVVSKGMTYKGCNLSNFLRLRNFEFILLFHKFRKLCDISCSDTCLEVVDALRLVPCMQGDFREYIADLTKHIEQFRQFFTILKLCSKESRVGASISHSVNFSCNSILIINCLLVWIMTI